MDAFDTNLNSLEQKLIALLNKLKENHLSIQKMEGELDHLSNAYTQLEKKHSALKLEHNALKVANGLLGSNESKQNTKRKLNTIINQVDRCIQQVEELSN